MKQIKKQNEWYLYKALVSSRYGVKWKISISNYWKEKKNWAGYKPNDFQYKIVDGKIVDVRNDILLANIFTKV